MNKSQRGERFGQDGRDRDEESIVTCQEDGRGGDGGGEADQLPLLPHGACFAATESLEPSSSWSSFLLCFHGLPVRPPCKAQLTMLLL